MPSVRPEWARSQPPKKRVFSPKVFSVFAAADPEPPQCVDTVCRPVARGMVNLEKREKISYKKGKGQKDPGHSSPQKRLSTENNQIFILNKNHTASVNIFSMLLFSTPDTLASPLGRRREGFTEDCQWRSMKSRETVKGHERNLLNI